MAPSDTLLQTLVESIPAMVAYCDSAGRCRFANRAFGRWFGRASEAPVGRPISEAFGASYERTRPYIDGALRGEAQQFELEIPDPEGGAPCHALAQLTPHSAEGRTLGFFVHVTDITAVKRTQRALEESEERFARTIDDAPIGMALVGLDGRFQRVNRVLCELLGYSADELMATTFQAITHPEDLQIGLAAADRLKRGELSRAQFEKRYLRKDGSVVDAVLSVSIAHGRDGTPLHFVSQIEDVTERKRLEERLRLAEARSSGILATSADGIISVDEEQRIRMFNSGAERIFGYSKAEVLGAPLDVLIPERFRPVHLAHVEEFARGSSVARRMGERMAVVGLRKNGEEFPADVAISRLEVGGHRILTAAVRDITDQKRREDEQRFLSEAGAVLAGSLDYEETLSRVAELAVRELADLCVVDLKGDDGVFRRVRTVCRLPSQQNVCDRLQEVDVDPERRHILQRVKQARGPILMQFPTPESLRELAQSEEHLQVLQTARIHSVLAVPLIPRGELIGAIGLLSCAGSPAYRDSDFRMAQELAHRAALSVDNALLYRKAQRATKARDDVLGVVAHDLRSPAQLILMRADALRRRLPNDHGATRDAGEIARSARRMSRLIQDLLDVSRIEAGRLSLEPHPLAAMDLLSEAIEAQQPLADAASIALRVEPAEGLPDVWGDKDRLLQVFENLINNAVKFSPRGSVVTVGAAPTGGEVMFWVTDRGGGLTEEQSRHLFDPFWQAPRPERKQGAGLGLPIVKGIVEAHRGKVWARSALGQGTTFFFTIPTTAQPEAWRREQQGL